MGLSDPGELTGYRIHGRGVVGDVRTEDGRLVLHRVQRADGKDMQGPLRLTQGELTFTDVSRASELRAEMKHQLGRLATGKGFLAMWHEYNRLETQFVRRQVRDVGFGRYTEREPLGDDIYRFRLDQSSRLDDQELTLAERARRAIDAREPLELEAAQNLPAALTGTEEQDDGSGWALIKDALGKETVRHGHRGGRLRGNHRPAAGGSGTAAGYRCGQGALGSATWSRFPAPLVSWRPAPDPAT